MDVRDAIEIADSACPSHSTRLLLPFTHGVDALALETAIVLAKNRCAMLVPVVFIHVPPFASGARLEHIQQSKDFLMMIKSKAAKYDIDVESHEIFTGDIIACLGDVRKQLKGEIILFVRDGDGVLLSTGEVKHILTHVAGQHHVIRLQRQPRRLPLHVLSRLLPRFQQMRHFAARG